MEYQLMPLRLPFALLAIAIDVIGLALDFYVIAGRMGPPQNRSLGDFLVFASPNVATVSQ